MPSRHEPDHPARKLLDETESELERRLREACAAETTGVATQSSEEIRELEDALLSAAVAARRTRLLREQVGGSGGEEPSTERAGAPRTPPSDASGSAVREFTDAAGRAWRAWPVTPGAARVSGKRFLGDFEDGWICFEALDSSGRRRLPCREPRWADLEERELVALLERSIDAPTREARGARGRERARDDADAGTTGEGGAPNADRFLRPGRYS